MAIVDPNLVNIINNETLHRYGHLQWGVFSHWMPENFKRIKIRWKKSNALMRFRVQRSRLKNPQTAHINRILSSLCLESCFTQWGMSGIPNHGQSGEQRPSIVT